MARGGRLGTRGYCPRGRSIINVLRLDSVLQSSSKGPSWSRAAKRTGEGYRGVERVVLLGHSSPGDLSAFLWDMAGLGILSGRGVACTGVLCGCGGWCRGAMLMRNTPGPRYGSWGPVFDDRAASRVTVARSRSELPRRMLRKLSSSG